MRLLQTIADRQLGVRIYYRETVATVFRIRPLGVQRPVPRLCTPITMEKYWAQGGGRLQSDGLFGVTADGVPTGAVVRVLQERDGVLMEVARSVTTDGSWAFSALPGKESIVLAEAEGRNAGVISKITPASEG